MLAPTLLLYLTLAACALAIVLVVVRYDLHDREPWHMVVFAILLGALGMWTAGQIQLELIHAIHSVGELVTNPMLAVMAGTTEEVAKLGVVAVVIVAGRRHFNDPLDGLVYGSFAGLGAALEESVAVLQHVDHISSMQLQEPVRLAGHLVMGGIGGFGTGLIAMRSRLARLGITLSLLAAVGLHTLWDVAAFDATDHFRLHHALLPWHTAVPMGIMLLGLIVYRNLVAIAARLARSRRRMEGTVERPCPA